MIYAPKPIGTRIALLGDASHSIHPLAGQGLNLSIEDCFQMLDLLLETIKEGREIGNYDDLKKYHNMRSFRVKTMVLATSSLHYTFSSNFSFFQRLLSIGMENLDKKSLKNIFKTLVING